MWFILVLFCAYLYISASVIAADDTCQGKYCAAHTNQRTFEPRGESLKLVSTGRRAKNLFVTTVDVYSVGVYISSDKERSLRKTKEVKFDVELSKSTIEKACLGVVLTFARDIGKSSIVDALVSALSKKDDPASYEASVQKFKSLLVTSIGDKGVKKGDEIVFVWTGKRIESLLVLVRGKQVGSIESTELRQRLASIYLGVDAVAPEVVSNLRSFFS